MKIFWSILLSFFVSINSGFGIASATFGSEDYYKIQVIIDGKVINQYPKHRVKIKGRADKYALEIRVFDEAGCLIYTHEDRFFASSGFQSDFQLAIRPENCSELIRIKISRIYSERIRRPDDFYNKQLIAMSDFTDQLFLTV